MSCPVRMSPWRGLKKETAGVRRRNGNLTLRRIGQHIAKLRQLISEQTTTNETCIFWN
jgi:hypothetical protein